MLELGAAFGLKSLFSNQLRKGRYWARKDGSKWWRNPTTNAIEPYRGKSGSNDILVSPKSYIGNYTDNEKKHLTDAIPQTLQEKISGFSDLPPEEQDRILDLVERPELLYLASNGILGSTLGINQDTNPDRFKPLSTKLIEAIVNTDLNQPVEQVISEAVSNYENEIAVFYTVFKSFFGDEMDDNIMEASEQVIPYIERSVHSVSHDRSTIDPSVISLGIMVFEDYLLKSVKKLINK